MSQRTWLVTGVSRGFGRELTDQLLARGDRVVGTVRGAGKVADLIKRYPRGNGRQLGHVGRGWASALRRRRDASRSY